MFAAAPNGSTCLYCKACLTSGASYCSSCNKYQTSCVNCGNDLTPKQDICPHCSYSQKHNKVSYIASWGKQVNTLMPFLAFTTSLIAMSLSLYPLIFDKSDPVVKRIILNKNAKELKVNILNSGKKPAYLIEDGAKYLWHKSDETPQGWVLKFKQQNTYGMIEIKPGLNTVSFRRKSILAEVAELVSKDTCKLTLYQYPYNSDVDALLENQFTKVINTNSGESISCLL